MPKSSASSLRAWVNVCNAAARASLIEPLVALRR
jgi:hypothetical protein